jgi:hypothetical protein
VIKRQALISHAYQDSMIVILGGARGEKERQSQQEKSGPTTRHVPDL